MPINTGATSTQAGDLILRNGPWHVGDEIEFSILVHNSDSETISSFLQIEIDGENYNGSIVEIESGNSVELKSLFVAKDSGNFGVNWTVFDATGNITETFSDSTEVIIYEKQSLLTEIYSLDYNYEDGFSINWGANLSLGNSRLISAEIYFLTSEENILASQIELDLESGLRTMNTVLGVAPNGANRVEIILTPIGWSSSTSSTDSQNIESEINGLTLGITAGPSPEFPTIGDIVTIEINLGNNGLVDTGPGKIIAVDGQKRILGEFNTPSVSSGSEELMQLNLNEWMSTSTTTLEIIWTMDGVLTKTNLEVISSNLNEVNEESVISINWMNVIIGLGVGLAVIFSVRIISVRNQSENKESKTYSTRNQKEEVKEETEKRSIDCPSCSKDLQVPIQYSGQVKCPSCLTQFSTKPEINIEEKSEIVLDDELTASSDDDVVGCPKCDQVLRVPYDKRPAKARCPACKCVFNALAI